MISKIFNIIFKDFSIMTFVLSVICLFLGIHFQLPSLSLWSSIFLFSGFDYVVFKKVFRESVTNNEGLVSYRIVQSTLQYFLGYLLYSNFGFQPTLWFFMLWWFGLCDQLYYLLGLEKFWEYGEYTWVSWTPIGVLGKLFKFPIYWYHLTSESVIILITYFILNI